MGWKEEKMANQEVDWVGGYPFVRGVNSPLKDKVEPLVIMKDIVDLAAEECMLDPDINE